MPRDELRVARWAFNEGIYISSTVCPELSCIHFVFMVTWHPSFRDPTAFRLFKQLLTSAFSCLLPPLLQLYSCVDLMWYVILLPLE